MTTKARAKSAPRKRAAKKPPDHVSTFRLPLPTYEALRAHAKKNHRDVSSHIRYLVEKDLEGAK